jgi:glycine/D-amino acid oxidase-like deaminating enzyme/nitrite reductase/ring-hydroxylating ferredoxin subunit
MKPQAGITLSLWTAITEVPQYPPLIRNLNADVCIIGAGITGLTCAYFLCKEGKNVIVIEDGTIASGETARTTAHITNIIDDRYYKVEFMHGEEGARLAADSQTAAINMIEEIVNTENISCDFERLDGYLFFSEKESDDNIEKEFEATKKVNIPVMKINDPPVKLTNRNPVFKYPGQAQFSALKYIAGLANAATSKGADIYCSTHASKIERGEKNVVVTTSTGLKITVTDVIIATNNPVTDLVSIYIKEASYRTFVIGARIPKGSVQKALYWDDLEPYHYVRIHEMPNYDILIVGGEDHKTGQEDNKDRWKCLEEWAKERFSMIESIDYRWSGQIVEPSDYLSYTGLEPEYKEHVYIATGDSGQGITHGTYSARLLTDMIMGKQNPWQKLYDPSRITLRASGEMFKENINMVAQMKDYLTGGNVKSEAEIKNDEGAIVRRGLNKVAIYRDKDGILHECSAICPHLKGMVRWNANEKTWDCPLHGSRFDAYGKVINGPANSDLGKG